MSISPGFQAVTICRRDDGIAADQRDQIGDLVDVAAVGGFPVAPLLAVDRAEVAVGIGPFVPDADACVLQPADVGVAAQEPQQLDDDRAQVQLLGGQQRKAVGKIEAHLGAEQRQGAGAGAVGLRDAFVEHFLHQIEIGPHRRPSISRASALGKGLLRCGAGSWKQFAHACR